jgi:hypothetical protein
MQPGLPSSDANSQSTGGSQMPDMSQLDTTAAGGRGIPNFPFTMPPMVPFDMSSITGHTSKKSSKPKQPKTKTYPPELEGIGPSSNAAYESALSDPSLTVSPQTLELLPSNYWLNLDNTFGDLVTKFFQRKNNANSRFPHKLFNALKLVEIFPNYYPLIGAQWVTDHIFKIDKFIFGRLLGITSIDGGLFHRQGNFPSHGFAELSAAEFDNLRGIVDISDVDQDRVRLLFHRGNSFNKSSTEESLLQCKWITESEPRQ